MRYSVSGGMSYPDAKKLVEELKTAGISADIAVGGIDIFPKDSQIDEMNRIVKKFNVSAQQGTTSAKELGSMK